MENLFLFAILSSTLFVLLKTIEMKYLEKEMKPLKFVIRDALMVFVSSFCAAFTAFYMKGSFSDFFNFITENKVINIDSTQVFTDSPGF
jgi:hypothetical protein